MSLASHPRAESERSDEHRYVGKHRRRIDSERKVDGSVEYTGDVHFEGLHARLVRSNVAHGVIGDIETDAAERKAGVRAVVTGRDLREADWITPYTGPAFRDQPLLAIGVTRYIGEPVAAVVAETPEAAEEAAELVTPRIERQPRVTTVNEARADDAPQLHEHEDVSAVFDDLKSVTAGTEPNVAYTYRADEGDVDAGFAAADVVVEGGYSTPMIQHIHLDPHVSIADFDRPTDSVTVISGTQTPHYVKQEIARLFDLPTANVTVSVPQMGGSYGSKTYARLEPLAAALSRFVGAPVRVRQTMGESFDTGVRDGTETTVKTGLTADGEIVAREIEIHWDTGAYADIGPRKVKKAGFTAIGPYAVEHARITSSCVYTNKPPGVAYRGFGVAQTAWAVESHMDDIAAELGMDPFELRRRNLVQDGSRYLGAPVGNTGVQACLEAVADATDWAGQAVVQPEAENLVRGRGLAVTFKATITPSSAEAIVLLDSDGSLTVLTGSAKVGQGVDSTLAQIAAEAFDVDIDRVAVPRPNTDVAPFNTGTNSSRTTYHVGNAVLRAVADIETQLVDFAEELWGVPRETIELADGNVASSEGPQAAISDLVGQYFAGGGGTVVGTGYYSTRSGDGDAGYGSEFWITGASLAEVTVDTSTGRYHVDRWVNAADAGTAIEPDRVRDQIEGASVQGLGHVFSEEIVYEGGQPVNKSLLDYKVPSIEDVPDDSTVVVVESNEPGGPYGAKGVGEANTITVPPAVANAVFDATGVRVPDLPVTPEKVLAGIRGEPR